ncbi:MAG: tail fiber domain-containing protein [Candidatus Avigastranaerophilus sp.]
MNKRLHGFTIAEMLISLLIISLVLSAAIPTITKKSASSDSIWQWSASSTSAYFGEAANQTAIIGDMYLTSMTPAILGSYLANIADFNDISDDYPHNITNMGDKLALVKQSSRLSDGTYSDIANSHISFYTMNNSLNSTDLNTLYTGRLVLEKHNIGLGIGTLANMVATTNTFQGKNTALGHYSLMKNVQGSYNTAVGEMALSKNTFASNNTVVGFNAGLNLDRDSDQIYSEDTSVNNTGIHNANGNTAIGSGAMQYNVSGRYNTAVGFNSLGTSNIGGIGNTAIGTNSCSLFPGHYSTCIGLNAANGLFDTATTAYAQTLIEDYDLDEGSGSHLLFIGSVPDNSTDVAPLIIGRMQSYLDTAGNIVPKSLDVNARSFRVNNFNGDTKIFQIETYSGANGVDTSNANRKGALMLNTNATDSKSIGLTVTSEGLDEVCLNINTSDTANNQGELWINKKALQISAIDNTSLSAVNITSKKTKNAAGEVTQYADFRLNGGQLTLMSNGDTILQNFDSSVANKTSAYVHIYKSNSGIDILSGSMEISTSTAGKAFVFGDKATTAEKASGIFRVGKSNSNFTSIFNGSVNIAGINTIGGTTGGTLDLVSNIKRLYDELSARISRLEATAFSDARLKNISGDNTAGLKEINALEVKNFTFKNDKEKTPHVGVIAQQLMKVFPNSVTKGKDGYYRIRTEEIFYAMVNSIKELCVQIQEITAKVTGLDKRLQKLEKENAELKQKNAEFEKRLQLLESKI